MIDINILYQKNGADVDIEYIKDRIYPNKDRHPEFQDITIQAGYNTVLLKQLETLEELLRAILAAQILNTREPLHTKLIEKYKGLL